tara:strand:+ start:218 stop:778 length:561 start_codon:yes stop_codon:yes gene_type:complete
MLELNKHDIFPTPIWILRGAPQGMVDVLYKDAYKYKANYKSENRSGKGGYQSPGLDWENFPTEPRKYFNDLLSTLPISTGCKIQLEGNKSPYWWYNINGKGDWNLPHVHPRSDLACVLYLTDTDNELTIMNPHHHTRMDLDGHEQYSSPKMNKGDMIIFPADLPHFVMPNKNDNERVSLSMNLTLR